MSAAPSPGTAPAGDGPGPAYLVRGDDASLVGQRAHDLLATLVGANDPAMVVEEHGGPGADELEVGLVVDALTTPPFLTDRRIVVVRDAGRLAAADGARLVACLDDALPGVCLVLVAGGGTIPAGLVKAVERHGTVIDTAVGTGRARTQWLVERLHEGPVKLDARAGARLGEHLGGDVSRLRGMLESLAAAYGEGASIDVERLEPFLGEAGAVAPWDLSDAIDAGTTAEALVALRRLFSAGGMHPLQVMAVLHRHFQAMLRLDGAGVTTPEAAAACLGTRSVYPAKKALEQGRRLGPVGIGRAMTLLADADLDVRGRSALPEETVLEVLVGRLSRLGAGRESSARRPRAGSSRRRS
ncbi:MAG TPA: DNA polymerase III subunit delta [Acidimicrobiales bacterium]|nr:DNA polymerase III subunit delta [Acidimicrobiales bacterium]